MARDLAALFFALADATRLRVLTLVAAEPRRASELAEVVGASRPGMSRHLRVLREAGLLRVEADALDGRAARLTLDRAPLDEASDFLASLSIHPREIGWDEQLASLKEVVEARSREAGEAQKRKRRRRAG